MKTQKSTKKIENPIQYLMGPLFTMVASDVKEVVSSPLMKELDQSFANFPRLSFGKMYHSIVTIHSNYDISEKELYYKRLYRILCNVSGKDAYLRRSIIRLCIFKKYDAFALISDGLDEEVFRYNKAKRSRFITTGRLIVSFIILNTMAFYIFDKITWPNMLIPNLGILLGCIATDVSHAPYHFKEDFLSFVADSLDKKKIPDFSSEKEKQEYLEQTVFAVLDTATLFAGIHNIPEPIMNRIGIEEDIADRFPKEWKELESEILTMFPFLLVHANGSKFEESEPEEPSLCVPGFMARDDKRKVDKNRTHTDTSDKESTKDTPKVNFCDLGEEEEKCKPLADELHTEDEEELNFDE